MKTQGWEVRRGGHARFRDEVLTRDLGVCHVCGQPGAGSLDHVVAWAHGGSNHPDNLRAAHDACNTGRGAAPVPDWAWTISSMWRPDETPTQAVQTQTRTTGRSALVGVAVGLAGLLAAVSYGASQPDAPAAPAPAPAAETVQTRTCAEWESEWNTSPANLAYEIEKDANRAGCLVGPR